MERRQGPQISALGIYRDAVRSSRSYVVKASGLRWQLEATSQGVRAHPGAETQRQWSGRAIARTTPVLMGLFSWVTLAVHSLQKRGPVTQRKAARKAARYAKPAPTFVNAIALVRRHLWIAPEGFSPSPPHPGDEKAPAELYAQLLEPLAYAAGRWPTPLECTKSRLEGV